jgi:predicted HicB family RNase H-like nuclease
MPETVVHFQIRMPPHLHEHLASRAKDEKTSLNALVVAILKEAADRREAGGSAPGPAVAPPR